MPIQSIADPRQQEHYLLYFHGLDIFMSECCFQSASKNCIQKHKKCILFLLASFYSHIDGVLFFCIIHIRVLIKGKKGKKDFVPSLISAGRSVNKKFHSVSVTLSLESTSSISSIEAYRRATSMTSRLH